MSFEFIKKLPTPDQIRAEYPVPDAMQELKKKRDQAISDVLTGRSDKFLVIIGPCSADNEDAVCEYVSRLARVNEKVNDKLILIPRVYTNKPRTTGDGYKGIVHQPDPEKETDFLKGIIAMRKMQLRVINESELTAADEMLYPENWGYVSDILSYVAIGARSVEDQQHRLGVSGFDVRHAQLRVRRTAPPPVHLPWLGSQHDRKSARAHDPARRSEQAWQQYPKLSL